MSKFIFFFKRNLAKLTHGVKSGKTTSKFEVSVGLETSGLYGASTENIYIKKS